MDFSDHQNKHEDFYQLCLMAIFILAGDPLCRYVSMSLSAFVCVSVCVTC